MNEEATKRINCKRKGMRVQCKALRSHRMAPNQETGTEAEAVSVSMTTSEGGM